VGQHNVYFASLNRNKKSVLLDLTVPDDKVAFEKLVTTSDALITNLRPRAIEKLGLTYNRLREFNPRLVCLALTGFGMSGPKSDLPAYDYVIQALSGVMMLTGEPDAPPTRVGYSVVDNTGGMMGAIAVLAKLAEGKGGQIDLSLMDTLLSQTNYLASAWLNAGEAPQRHPGGGHAFFVPAQTFRTRDGHVALFITHDEFWRLFATKLGRADWMSDARFATMKARHEHRDVVVAEIQQELLKRTADEWVALLQPEGVVIAPVQTLAEALSDPEAAARGMIMQIGTEAGPLRLVGEPFHIGRSSHEPPPLLGQHNRELLSKPEP
jgi:crotonobetainyl-CoA:carnitine CoA-transferase CaiB-like acyl-CoA transferase